MKITLTNDRSINGFSSYRRCFVIPSYRFASANIAENVDLWQRYFFLPERRVIASGFLDAGLNLFIRIIGAHNIESIIKVDG